MSEEVWTTFIKKEAKSVKDWKESWGSMFTSDSECLESNVAGRDMRETPLVRDAFEKSSSLREVSLV